MHFRTLGVSGVHELGQDLRYAIRILAKTPGFTLVALFTLALGIGANTLMFSVIDAVLLQRLPYRDPDALVAITARNLDTSLTGAAVSYTKFTQVREQSRTLQSAAAIFPFSASLATTNREPSLLSAARVSHGFFPLLGAAVARGRDFLPEEDRPGGGEVAVVSDALWRNRFGGDPGLVGATIALDGKSVTVVGILRADFRYPFQQPEPDVWLPRVFEIPSLTPQQIQSGAGYLGVIGRLGDGQTLPQAQAELDSISNAYKQAFPDYVDGAKMGLAVGSLQEALVGAVRPSLLALLGAVACVLLIAGVNVASLLLARAQVRAREVAIRIALGASQRRLLRQLLTESVVLSGLGGVLGVWLAAACLPLLRALDDTLPRAASIHIDLPVLLASLLLCGLTGIGFGLMPALQLARGQVQERLREGGRGSTDAAGGGRMRQLVVGEVALALVLVTGAGLLLRSFALLAHVDPGFASDGVTTFPFTLPVARYAEPALQAGFYQRLVERVATLPSVQSAGVVSYLPLSGALRFVYYCPEGTVCQGLGKDPIIAIRQVTPGFFAALRVPLLRGRLLQEQDSATAPLVVVVNETVARRHFSGVDPIGKHLANSRDKIPLEIVGVVGDVKFTTLGAASAEEMYLPQAQSPALASTLVVRAGGDPQPLVAAVREVAQQLDPNLAIGQIQSMDSVVSASLAQPRLTAQLVAAFALLALTLASVGIYGVMAYTVTQRTQEMQIRIALGARPRDIFRLVLGQGARLAGLGIGVGILASFAVNRLLTTLLFATSPSDPLTYAAVALLLLAVAGAACSLPARRATRADALLALR